MGSSRYKIAFFDDDLEFTEVTADLLCAERYELCPFQSLAEVPWSEVSVAVGDYCNTQVSFSSLKKACETHQIPLIAISGGDAPYPVRLLKPFTIEAFEKMLQSQIDSSFSAKPKVA